MKQFLAVIVCLGLILSFFLLSTPVSAYYTNMSASVVIGQSDFLSATGGNGAGNLGSGNIRGILVDPAGRLIISDGNNNRVLIWNKVPTTNGTPANLVLGQADFGLGSANRGGSADANTLNAPGGIWSDGSRLFITDANNNRVLVWNTFPTQNGQSADMVIGQSSMSATTNTCDSLHLSLPYGVAIYQGKLIVSSSSQARVLIWNSTPTANGQNADLVIGQTDLGTCTTGQPASSTTFNQPRGIRVDINGKLFVSDRLNARVLIWNSIPTSNNKPADVVVGKPNFTTGSGGTLSASNLDSGAPLDIYSTGGRLFVISQGVARAAIYNSIPTENGASADIAVGQPDLSSNLINPGGVSNHGFGNTNSVYVTENQLFVGDESNARVLIFNNVIATPEISFGGVEKLSFGKVRIKGTVKMGEAGHYDLGAGGGVSFSVNGVDGAGVNTIGNQNSDGAGNLLYDFSNEFEAWTGGNGNKEDWVGSFDTLRSSRGFSVKVTSRNSNTDSSRIFYFEPFKITSFSPSVFKFSVNKYQVQTIKDNVDHFEIWVKNTASTTSTSSTIGSSLPTSSFSSWTKYLDGILPDKIDVTTGEAVVSTTSLTQTPLISLLKGKYEVKVVAVSKDSNFRQDSQNTISQTFDNPTPLLSYINPNNYQPTTNQWFPLQLEKALGTNMGIISSFNLGSVSTFPYISQDLSLRLSGTSSVGSTVAVRVTDTASGSHKDYLTTTNKDSTFTIFHSLYPTSILTISTFDTNGHFNLLPPIPVTTNP